MSNDTVRNYDNMPRSTKLNPSALATKSLLIISRLYIEIEHLFDEPMQRSAMFALIATFRFNFMYNEKMTWIHDVSGSKSGAIIANSIMLEIYRTQIKTESSVYRCI